ncbi:MAG: glycoside hydrolase family 88 protein [bacterium]|nr:glycoside hydrolase family 88 protein [candidate division KSB1 bacterium]MDH7560906.1 glycoside hydrolase family 88 protein [bacterium]
MGAAVQLLQRHQRRKRVLYLAWRHKLAVTSCQRAEGLWHEVPAKPDSDLEASCLAMFVYAAARRANQASCPTMR